jgi:hypothetical protein
VRQGTGVALVVPLLALVLTTPGCAACLAAPEGITVRAPDALLTRSDRLLLEICDDEGCASAVERVSRSQGQGEPGELFVSFGDVQRHFDEGVVEVTAELRTQAGRRLATTRQDVELVGERAGGSSCEEFVAGELVLRP